MTHKIVFNKRKCVGAKKCLVSSLFSFDESQNQALLKNNPNSVEISIKLDDDELKNVVRAGEEGPVNAIGVLKETENGYKEIVSTNIKSNAGDTIIYAYYDDLNEFVMDPNGYFLIRTIPETKEIEIGHCEKVNEVNIVIRGKKPREIYQVALTRGLISRMDHAAYLGRELQKAYNSLHFGLKYVQDEELKNGQN